MLEHLYSELKAANARCETLNKMVTQYQDELIPRYRERAEKAERERDAAVRDLKLCAGFGDSLCHFCKTDSEECSSCISGTRWQWRGPQEE